MSLNVKLSPGPAKYLFVFNKLLVCFSYLCIAMTVPVDSTGTVLTRTGLKESASLSLVHLHTKSLHYNICEYIGARPTTYQWGRLSLPHLEVVFCWQLVAAISFPCMTLYQDSCTGIVTLVSVHQWLEDSGQTTYSHYRIGVRGWAWIWEACLVRVVTTLPETNVIMP